MRKAAVEETDCPFWPKELVALRSNIIQSKTLCPKLQKLITALTEHSFQGLQMAMTELPTLKKKMRIGATERLGEKILEELAY
eukprot:11203613-Lingulodinium_polyedra.AAC.1